METFRGGQFDSHFHRVVISVRGPVIDLGGPRHLRVKGEDSMNIAYVSLCDEEIIDEVSCAKPGVPPGRFVALSGPGVSYCEPMFVAELT